MLQIRKGCRPLKRKWTALLLTICLGLALAVFSAGSGSAAETQVKPAADRAKKHALTERFLRDLAGVLGEEAVGEAFNVPAVSPAWRALPPGGLGRGGAAEEEAGAPLKKKIVCFGDSNTYGYCADPSDCADGGGRFNEHERWTCLLQEALGENYLVLEEGLSGRTTAFRDPQLAGMSGLEAIVPCLMRHGPVDLLILMLGTNDTKPHLHAAPAQIAEGMEQLARRAVSAPVWRSGRANILIIAPPHIGEGIHLYPGWAGACQGMPEKSSALAALYAELARRCGFAFLDAEGLAEFNRTDFMHLTRLGHRQLAAALAELVPMLL